MRARARLLALALATLPAAGVTPAAAQPSAHPSTDAHGGRAIARSAGVAAGLHYQELVVGGADPADPLPMVVALHPWGAGPRGMGHLFERGFDHPARIVLPRGPLRYRSGYSWIDARATDPDPVLAADVRRTADRLARFVAAVRRERPTVGTPIVTGFSQGGVMAFALAVLHPDQVGVAFPVAGLLPRPLWPRSDSAGYPRIVALHGARDTLVPFVRTRAATAYMQHIGLDVELHPVAHVGHRWTSTMRRTVRGWIGDAVDRRLAAAGAP